VTIDVRVSWFWANRAYEIGIAPQPIARAQLTAGALLQAIDRATSAQTTQRYAPSRTTLSEARRLLTTATGCGS
jgi:hypothetical protein